MSSEADDFRLCKHHNCIVSPTEKKYQPLQQSKQLHTESFNSSFFPSDLKICSLRSPCKYNVGKTQETKSTGNVTGHN